MVPLTALLLPILLAAVIVFVASSLIHMVLKYHQSDYRQLPEEEKLLGALRPAGLTPGLYHFPFCTHKDMNTPAMQEKYKQGPVGFLTIYPSAPPAHAKVPRSVVCVLPAHRFVCCLSHRTHRYVRRAIFGRVSRCWNRRVPGLQFGSHGQRHLEGPALEHGLQGVLRWPHL